MISLMSRMLRKKRKANRKNKLKLKLIMLKTAYLEGRRSSVLEFPTGAPAVLLITSQGFFSWAYQPLIYLHDTFVFYFLLS